jgi:hypothetical protein
MEQRTIIRFFTLKRLKARAIQLELVSVYGLDALALLTVKKGADAFSKGEQTSVTILGLADR